LALYARNVLQGLRGGGDLISSATRARLHNPGDSADANYGGGWVIEDGKERGVIHWHNGSAGTFYSLVRIESESNRAAVVIFNIAGPGTQGMAGRVALELLDWKLSE
jgi:hypothetical protein